MNTVCNVIFCCIGVFFLLLSIKVSKLFPVTFLTCLIEKIVIFFLQEESKLLDFKPLHPIHTSLKKIVNDIWAFLYNFSSRFTKSLLPFIKHSIWHIDIYQSLVFELNLRKCLIFNLSLTYPAFSYLCYYITHIFHSWQLSCFCRFWWWHLTFSFYSFHIALHSETFMHFFVI